MLGNQYVYVDLTSARPYRNIGGEATSFGPWVGGQAVTVSLRFIERDTAGAYKQIGDQAGRVRNIRVGVGKIDARPVSGHYVVRINGVNSSPLDWNAGAIELQDAFNGLPFDLVCDEDEGGLFIAALDGRDLTIEVNTEELWPRSSARVLLRFIDGRKSYHLRLFQLPLAYTEYAEPVLPEPPTIKEVQAGGNLDGVTKWSEIQSLYVPPDFDGVYQLLAPWSSKRTGLLSRLDGTAALQAALLPVVGAVNVTNPLNNEAYITFVGDNLGIDFPELTVLVPTAPEPDLQFTLDLNTNEIYEALKASASITVPFEAEMVVDVDPSDSSKGTALVKLWQTEVVIRRPLLIEGMSSAAPIGWQRRSLPFDYVPFSKEQLLVGQQQAFVSVIGNGLDKEFVVDHNLGGIFQGKGIDTSTPGVGVTTFRVPQHGLVNGKLVTVLEHSAQELNGVHVATRVDADRFTIAKVVSAAGTGGYIASQAGESVEGGVDFYSKVGVSNVVLRENGVGGKMLTSGYEVFFLSPQTLKIVFQNAPTNQQYVAIVIGYGPKSAFLVHTHSIDQISNEGERLRDILDDFSERISRLEALLPKAGGLPSGNSKKKNQIPPIGEILPDIALEDGGENYTLASQVIAPPQKNQPIEVISGTELDDQNKALQKQISDLKAEKDAFAAQLAETARNAVQDYKKQLELEAQKQASKVVTKATLSGKYASVDRQGDKVVYTPVSFPAKRGAKYGLLLPALHSASPLARTSVPSVFGDRAVYQNTSGRSMVLPGGGGRKSQSIEPLGFFGGDGRALYAVRRMGGTNSFYPVEMERELIGVSIQTKQFPISSALSLIWNLEMALESDNVLSTGYLMEVRVAGLLDVAVPAVTGPNIGALGQSALIGAARFGLSRGARDSRTFSIKLSRLQDGTSTSEFTEFGLKTSGPAIPEGNLFISAKLLAWDVDDSTASPAGQVSLLLPDAYLTVEQI